MRTDHTILQKTVARALSGEGAHAASKNMFQGLDWKLAGARPEGAPHSIFQIVGHLTFWQDWVVEWLDGGKPQVPKHAAGSWPKDPAPAGKREWDKAVKAFRRGLDGLERRARKADLLAQRGKHTPLGMLHAIASHNSHHLGQVVMLRQMLGAWPPPSGGVTW
ncbi:MAG: DinB family protein [Terriglobia bacterium]